MQEQKSKIGQGTRSNWVRVAGGRVIRCKREMVTGPHSASPASELTHDRAGTHSAKYP